MKPELVPLLVVEGDVLHRPPSGQHRWTTRNFAEAVPGVPTALTWSIWGPGSDAAGWWVYLGSGLFSAREVALLREEGQSTASVFYGHFAGNVDLMSQAVARTPGQDVELFERDFFGIEPSGQAPPSTLRRLPFMLAKGPRLVASQRRRLDEIAAESRTWWATHTSRDLGVTDAFGLLSETKQRFAETMAVHSFQSSLAQSAFGKVATIAAAAGHPGLELRLVSGQGHTAEVEVAGDLWALSRGELDKDTFLERHGYHGPDEGEISSTSWRQDAAPVDASAAALRERPDGESPAANVDRQSEQASEAERTLLAGMGRFARYRATRAIKAARTAVPRREVGKTAFLQILDVARHAAATIGDEWAREGIIDAPGDIFDLTVEEVADPPTNLRELIAERKATRAEYQSVELPEYWVGPDPDVSRHEATAAITLSEGDVVHGLAAAPGATTGTARVVLDRDAAEPLGPDEILVTRTTDPGWLSIFMDAGGMVVDVGGPMSHAAIVARELGVPCVINTGDGTTQIPDGAVIAIDGDAGTATIESLPT